MRRISMSAVEIPNTCFNPATLLIKLIKGERPGEHLGLFADIPDDLPQFVLGAEHEIRCCCVNSCKMR